MTKRTEGEELLILLEFIKLKMNYKLSNFEIKNYCKTLTKPTTEREEYLLNEALKRDR